MAIFNYYSKVFSSRYLVVLSSLVNYHRKYLFACKMARLVVASVLLLGSSALVVPVVHHASGLSLSVCKRGGGGSKFAGEVSSSSRASSDGVLNLTAINLATHNNDNNDNIKPALQRDDRRVIRRDGFRTNGNDGATSKPIISTSPHRLLAKLVRASNHGRSSPIQPLYNDDTTSDVPEGTNSDSDGVLSTSSISFEMDKETDPVSVAERQNVSIAERRNLEYPLLETPKESTPRDSERSSPSGKTKSLFRGLSPGSKTRIFQDDR